MKTITELTALQNAATDIGLTIHPKYQHDKRCSVGKYFANENDETISPVLDYEQMNHFLLGYRRAIKALKTY